MPFLGLSEKMKLIGFGGEFFFFFFLSLCIKMCGTVNGKMKTKFIFYLSLYFDDLEAKEGNSIF